MITRSDMTGRGVAIAIALVGISKIAGGQSVLNTFCWSQRSLDAGCRSFAVVEAGGVFALDGSGWNAYDVTIGRMRNGDRGSASGPTASLSIGGSVQGGRIEWRQRRWIGTKFGIDLSGGASIRTLGVDTGTAYGLTAAIGTSDALLGLNGRVDLLQDRRRTVVLPTIGLQLRGKSVPVVAGGAAVGMLIFVFGYAGAST